MSINDIFPNLDIRFFFEKLKKPLKSEKNYIDTNSAFTAKMKNSCDFAPWNREFWFQCSSGFVLISFYALLKMWNTRNCFRGGLNLEKSRMSEFILEVVMRGVVFPL